MLAGLVLAAGTSSRLGRPKQTLPLAGKPLIRHALDAALDAGLDPVVVVLGSAADDVRTTLPSGERIRVVENPDFAQGQSTSLRAGLHAMGEDVEAVVVLLADQPTVRPDAIRAVTDAFVRSRAPIVQASYRGRPAHPTLLAREVWPDVERTTGDRGARSVIANRRGDVTLVEVGGEAPQDLDTEHDYQRLLDALERDR